MDPKDFDDLLESVGQAASHLNGEDVPGLRVHIPATIDTRAIRGKMGLSQAQFAERYGLSAGAVRDWEQGRRMPEAGTRAFLTVLAKEPEAVERALASV